MALINDDNRVISVINGALCDVRYGDLNINDIYLVRSSEDKLLVFVKGIRKDKLIKNFTDWSEAFMLLMDGFYNIKKNNR